MLISIGWYRAVSPRYCCATWDTLAKNSVHRMQCIRIPMSTDYWFDPHKKFQVAFSCDTGLKYQIWTFCYCLFLSYVDNMCTHMHTNRQTDAHTKTKGWKCDFQIQRTSKLINPSKFQLQKFFSKSVLSLSQMNKSR